MGDEACQLAKNSAGEQSMTRAVFSSLRAVGLPLAYCITEGCVMPVLSAMV